MGYMLPLRYINVSKEPKVAICATRIVAMMSTDIYQARRTIHDEKLAGKLVNACGNNAAKTAIILDNGTVVSSPMTITVLMSAIERSNNKANVKNTARLRVYDVYDEDPDPDDEDVPEIDSLDEDYDDDDDYDDE